MCGIVVLFGPEVSRGACQTILAQQAHRGPDGTSITPFLLGYIGFNRLAINDKSSLGNQPFEFGEWIGVFNCEIYNASNLKIHFNLQLKSGSDAEVILPLFVKKGYKTIDLLDGFYSGVIANRFTGEVLFIRDYIGKKPLFWGRTASFEFVASELKGIPDLLEFQVVPKGISRLGKNGPESVHLHSTSEKPPASLKSALFEAVIKRISNPEEKTGLFLSGGLDSSIVASIANSASDNIVYYCLGNPGSEDLQYVSLLVEKLGLKHRVKYVPLPEKAEMPALIQRLVYITESFNPSIVSNGIATYLLAKAANEDGLKVVLSGDGADELFCGYKLTREKENWYRHRETLIENLHQTELRRLDLSSMSSAIEVRCPFLDREVYRIAKGLKIKDLIDDFPVLKGKMILRELFKNELPLAILNRAKMSCDVGTGIRKLIASYFESKPSQEKEHLKKIWGNFFPVSLSEESYFSDYPVFDPYINKRLLNKRGD